MRIISICTTVLFLIIHSFCIASELSDSLKNILKQARAEKQAEVLNKISDHYYHINTDSSFHYAQQALEMAKQYNNEGEILNSYLKIGLINQIHGQINESFQFLQKAHEIAMKSGSPKGLILSHFYFGAYYYYKGQLDSSLSNFNESLRHCEKNKNFKYKLRNLNNIGNIYWARGDSEQALKYYLQSYQLADSIKDQKVLTFALFNLGNVYLNQNRNEEAIKYYNQVYNLAQKDENTTLQANVLNNLGIISRNSKNYTKAIEQAKEANRLYRKINDNTGISLTYSNMGNAFYHLGQQDSAIYFINKALLINRNSNNKKELALDLEFLSNIYLDNKNQKKALPYIQEGLKLTKLIGLDSESNFLRLLSRYHYLQNNYKKAFDYKVQQYALTDSIYTKEKAEKIAELQTRFESEKKEKENELLRIKNNLVNVQLEQQKKIRNYSVAFAVVALLLSLVIFGLMRAKIKSSRKIKKINEELEKINEKLIAANASKDKFFSIIAHDLRSPFNAILGFSDLLDEEMNNDADMELMQEYNSCMNESSHKLFNLLENILEWANSQKGNINFNPEVFDLYELIQINLEIFKLKAQDKGIQLVSTIQPKTKVFGDKNMINTILRNLINNALKFTNPNGTVEIFTSREKDILDISVKDNGIGISEENQTKLFKIDSNYSSTGTHEEQGTGLGLILCKEFIDKHDGNIWVKSQPNMGSIFSFSLKLGNSQTQAVV